MRFQHKTLILLAIHKALGYDKPHDGCDLHHEEFFFGNRFCAEGKIREERLIQHFQPLTSTK